jgi:hypothetical protein
MPRSAFVRLVDVTAPAPCFATSSKLTGVDLHALCCPAVASNTPLPAFCERGLTPSKLLMLLDAKEGNALFFQNLSGEARQHDRHAQSC